MNPQSIQAGLRFSRYTCNNTRTKSHVIKVAIYVSLCGLGARLVVSVCCENLTRGKRVNGVRSEKSFNFWG